MADLGSVHVVERYRRRGLGTWLVREAAEWLKLARLERLLAYARPDESEQCAFS
ncbi:MAG: GNAT family N-acetyltransferase [Chloroflexi bacterium]|nr:GNAT family N-acetyltransferase [Chloroflexota bacterium]